MRYLQLILAWTHIMGMVGAFGSLIVVQFGLPRDVRDSAAGARVGPQLISWMLGAGLLAGLVLVFLRFKQMGGSPGGHFWGVIGVKFLLLLVAGAAVGISSAKLRAGLVRTAGRLRLVAIVSLALAALFGAML